MKRSEADWGFLESLYRELWKKLCIYAENQLGDGEAAQDIVHEAFLIACKKMDALRASENPKGWILCTVKNCIRNHLRKEAQRRLLLYSMLAGEEPGAQDAGSEMEIADMLSPQDYLLVKLTVLEQLPVKDAAEKLNISEAAARQRLHRAKARLKRQIEEAEHTAG